MNQTTNNRSQSSSTTENDTTTPHISQLLDQSGIFDVAARSSHSQSNGGESEFSASHETIRERLRHFESSFGVGTGNGDNNEAAQTQLLLSTLMDSPLIRENLQNLQSEGANQSQDGNENGIELFNLLNSFSNNSSSSSASSKVSQEFLDRLPRVSKSQLTHSDTCPICTENFLDDPYPLIVHLPCNKRHRFDLECISGWLKLKSCCPLCRHDLDEEKSRQERIKKDLETKKADSEDEWDDMYG